MNKQQLAARIWSSANKMRSKIEANEYKDYILGFIFYMFLSNKEVDFLKKDGWTDEDMKTDLLETSEEEVKYCKEHLGYFIAYPNLFSTWLGKGTDFTVDDVAIALSAFSRNINPSHKKVFQGIFKTLETGLTKLGESQAAQTKSIRDLIQLIKDVPTDGKQDYDVLGFIYEYLISNFAANAGKKAGEFYTPHEVSTVMSEIIANHLKGREEIEIYDPTSGSGSLLINIGRSVGQYMTSKDNIKYYAQELKENTFNLTRMNLVMRGIIPDNIVVRNGDTLEDDWPFFENEDRDTYELLRVDAVVSNPPYSQSWDPENKDNDPRFKRYGVAPSGKADYAFLLHTLYHIKPDGIVTIVLPHGVLFRGGEEEKIRRNLIESNNIDAVIGLPANIFFGTSIPTIIMVLKQKRANTDVLFIDASKGFEKAGNNNKLRACDIKKIVDTVAERGPGDGKYSKLVTREEIRANEYNLNIPRYVDSSEKSEFFDIYATMFGGIPNKEIDNLADYWNEFPSLKSELFGFVSEGYSSLAVEKTKEVVRANKDVIRFTNTFKTNFEDFPERLEQTLVEEMLSINVSKEEKEISEDITKRLSYTSLIDPYEAYQVLDEQWNKIATDLEIIQTEGIDSIKKVDPNIVTKKKGKDDVEVQEGWRGRILPFELVQKELLGEEFGKLNELQSKLDECDSVISEMAESLTEEEKGSEVFDAEKETFVSAEITKEARRIVKESKMTAAEALAKFGEDAFEYKVLRVNVATMEKKAVAKELKTLSTQMIELTKKTIEELDEPTYKRLLSKKWISPIQEALAKLPQNVVDKLCGLISALQKKYDETLVDIDDQINSVGKDLASMIDELEGDENDMMGLSEFKKTLGLGGGK